jgi:uncharacterized repeat protein (TIGR03803 family)
MALTRSRVRAGNRIGIRVGLLLAVVVIVGVARAQTSQFETLFQFTGNNNSPFPGSTPVANLVAGPNGVLYGTTYLGGVNNSGVIFQASKQGSTWVETVLYQFTGAFDGANPDGPLLLNTKTGVLYGTTSFGGNGFGTVFSLTPASSPPWNLNTLHSFSGGDGARPSGALALVGGVLYGTTYNGGTHGRGTVFARSLTGSNSFQSLYSFGSQPSDGAIPYSGVVAVAGSSLTLYGTTLYGGAAPNCPNGCGTVFALTVVSPLPSPPPTLFSFTGLSGASPGATPSAGLVRNKSNGVFYGTTVSGGNQNVGTVFEFNPASSPGALTMLYSFKGGQNDGANPFGSVILYLNQRLYGTTANGGDLAACPANGCGTVFSLQQSAGIWSSSIVYAFQNGNDEAHPFAGLVLGNGYLYGTTAPMAPPLPPYAAPAHSGFGTAFSVGCTKRPPCCGGCAAALPKLVH